MTFNIGYQAGGIVNNVAGDQRVSGGQHGQLATTEDARQALSYLRQALLASPLAEDPTVTEQVGEMDAALCTRRPDRPRLARALQRLTQLLIAAGSLTTAGQALIGPLHALACWLGTAGEPVLNLLPALS